jgi:radical S-adenosyl methionine domain-containing protein 2
MASSYLLLNEYMCFLDKGEGMLTRSESIPNDSCAMFT